MILVCLSKCNIQSAVDQETATQASFQAFEISSQ